MAQKYVRPTTASRTTSPAEQAPVNFIFDKSNYTLLAVSVVVVALGFVLMSGNTDIYSNTKIVVAPIVVLAGFGLGFYSIFKKPATKA
ncbi:DUF3098 domain-containing protein [Mucilaginibacter sp. RS28]|uniref:DUF3098 domain-containing protein n=1 Tax=Mucilaginibacter straminoryzae TaxID=2932774 RepID=A0A9X1X6A3_9SPHI|nr:DUF3098 domain-containing protein [Mucilaginibacter straminoryzae]MCJ8211917.1 DUF3098 domain-containing protein [Mucilaginibacter straminoryzae]